VKRFVQLLLAAGCALLVLPRPVLATTYVVSKTVDTNDFACDADCSLREAIYAANASPSDDTITFDPTVFATPQTIVLSGVNITIDGNGTLEIIGPGTSAGPAGNGVTFSGNATSRILTTANTAVVTIRRVSFTSGNGVGSVTNFQGGAIFNTGTLTLDTVQITNCSADTGGGIASWSAGGSPPALTITNSIISGNTAVFGGGVMSGTNAREAFR